MPTRVAVPASAAVTKNVPPAAGSAYTAGRVAVAVMENGALLIPFACTMTWTGPGATAAGTSALICVGLT